MSLDAVLAQIDAYPTPKGVNAETWTTLTTELKRLLIARSKDGKTISIAPTGLANAVSDLAAVSNPAGTQATVTWTEKLAGDCNNDGQVSITDLQPIAAHYGETSSGTGSAAYLADADGDGQVGITDLQPIANNYMARIEGYQVWRGHYDGTSTDWDATFRPNVGNPTNTSFSVDRATTPPATSRPAYTYLDDISGLTDKANVRYRVVPFGDGTGGVESNEAIMVPPGAPTYSVSGTVTEGGVGLASVTMTLTPGGLNATTQADGTYTITGVADGNYTLAPSLTGHTFTPPTRAVNVSGADLTAQDFTAAVVYSVSGTVLETGVGLAGVTMTLTPSGLNATTQADGTYTIAGVADGNYTLTPSLTGYTFTPATRSVTVAGADVTSQDFAATAVGHSVSGTVLEGANGLAGVTMTLAPGGLNATTQADGTYTIAGVADGNYTLTPSLTGYTFTPTTRQVSVAGADVTSQDFAATAGGYSVSGIVTEGATGLAGVTLALTPGGLNATTQADGTYTILGVVDGNYTLTPSLTGYTFTPATRSVTVAGADVASQDFAATAVGHSVSGTVTQGATGLAGVTLTLTPGAQSTMTQADGTYSIPGVADGGYTLTPSLTGYIFTPTNRPVTVAGADVTGQDFTATAVHNVSGTVLDTTSAGLPGVTLTLTPGGLNATTQANGTYTIAGVADGNYTLTPSLTGYIFAPTSRFVTVAGADVTGRNFTATPVGLADTPWPKFHGNSGNTGLSPYVGAQTNQLKWSHPTGNSVHSSPAVGADGTIYVGSDDKNVYALNAPDGTVKWSFATGDIVRSSPAIGADGTVYVGSCDKKVYAFNPANGSVKWRRPTGSSGGDSSPAIGADGTLYIGSSNNRVYALNPADGSVKWSHPTSGMVSSSPAIGADGTVYIGSVDNNVYALNPADGSVKWMYATGGAVYSSPAIGADGTVYVGSYDDMVYALNPADGSVKWTHPFGDYVYSSPAIGADGTVYVGSMDYHVYALDPFGGSVKWSYATGDWVTSSPAIGADGTVYVGSYDKNVYALNPADGSVKWSYATADWVESSPAIGADGTVYIGSDDNSVYAVGP